MNFSLGGKAIAGGMENGANKGQKLRPKEARFGTIVCPFFKRH